MEKQLHFLCRFLLSTGRSFAFTLVGLLGLLAPVWATSTVTPAAPTDLIVSVSSATVCAGTSISLTASGCPANGAIRWSTTQTGSVIAVVPKQTTTYTAICEVTSTSVATSTATSSTATSSTATSSTATSSTATSTTSLVTTVTATTATGTVQVYTPIVVTLDPRPPLCNKGDGGIVVNGSGGVGLLQYQLNGQPFQTNNAFGSLKAGIYPLVVKDAIGCMVQMNAELTQPSPLSVSLTTIGTKCVGGSDGGVNAVASGGVGDYRYAILDKTTPQISGFFVDLKANTTYTLIVSDKNNCVIYQPVFIGQPTPFTIKLTAVPTRCTGSADGSITIDVTGGSGTYQYQLGSGSFQTGTQFTGLAAATYEITIQDAVGCQGKQSATVGQPALLKLTAVSKPVNCLGPNTGSIIATASGGTGAITYQIANKAAQASNVLTGIAVGDYTVVGTDANGCTGLAPVTVSKIDPLKIQATILPATCCICPTGAAKLNTTGGTGTGLQFQLIGTAYQTNSQINKLTPNTYRFRAIDDGGCTDSVAAVVTDGNALTLSIGKMKGVSCSGGRDGEATVQVAGGAKPFTYYWQTERRDTLKPFSATQTGLSEATYTVSVRDSNRCTTTTLFVTLNALNQTPYKPSISQVGNSSLVAEQTVGVQWYVRTGTNPGTPVPNATGATLVPFASGQYYIIVTVNGCSSPPSDALNFILTALNEPTTPLSVRVVPNPIVDRLRLEIEQPERSSVQVQLLDASGRAVRQYQIPAFTGKKQAEWPMDGMATGAYLLKVATESRQSMLRVVVE